MTQEKTMPNSRSRLLAIAVAIPVILMTMLIPAGDASAGEGDSPPELYTVATAHLDTQWRWTIQKTIDEYLYNTLHDNFALFEKYPHYVFNFEGSFRYQLMGEYYPSAYQRMKDYIAAGRWRVAGSWVDAVDVNVPSPESLIRHTLYGNGFFAREFGRRSRDVFLPDCFGFGYALPSIAAHSGLLGFSTQKLTWGCYIGIPFNLGVWEGVDGSTLVAAVNPGSYTSDLTTDLSADSTWVETVLDQERASGVAKAFMYFGTGDTGGAPTDASVDWLEKSLQGDGPLQVLSVASDQIMRDITPAQQAGLPRYKGELLMTRHGVGCYTSQSAMKRWNRGNEVLADAAERVAVTADWLGASRYPGEVLETAWTRFLWHQFHDDLTGTSIPEAYYFSWNDELISLNQFASVVTDAVGGVSRALDTRAAGIPLVVYNPLAIEREDLVTAAVVFTGGQPRHVRVFDPDGNEVPAQWADGHVVFLARVPPVGFAVYDVRPAVEPCRLATCMRGDQVLENKRYRVHLGADGTLASIHDKQHDRELLSRPLEFQLLDDAPANWAAWEIDYEDLMAEPRTVAAGDRPWTVDADAGPARISARSELKADGSTITMTVSLGAGAASDRIDIALDIDWRTPGTLLKAAFPLAVANPTVTYDLGLGVIERGLNQPDLYEVPGQRWADLTAADGTYGVAVLNDSRYGWDHPDENTLRLTLTHTPAVNRNWSWVSDQASQDLGRHRVNLALYAHVDDWRQGVVWQADRLNQPLLAFQVPAHAGSLGREFSLLQLRDGSGGRAGLPVAVRAIKLAEQGDEIVIRLQELTGKPVDNLQVDFTGDILAVRELNGAEEPVDPAGLMEITDGNLHVAFLPFRPRTLAVRLADPPVSLDEPLAAPLDLAFNLDGISRDDDPTDGDFDGRGHTIAGDLMPGAIEREGIVFNTGPQAPGAANVLVCRGQELAVPDGDFDSVYLLAAAVNGGRSATFDVDGQPATLWIQDWAAPVGQWDNRLVGGVTYHDPEQISPAYINRDEVAWVGTHRHGPDGRNEAYVFTHFFKYRLDLPPGAGAIRLPVDENVRILAATAVSSGNDDAVAVVDLYDRPAGTSVEIVTERRRFLEEVTVTLRSPNPSPQIHYTVHTADGDQDARLYSGPFVLDEDCRLLAWAESPGLAVGRPVSARFEKMVARAAPFALGEEPAGLEPGLAYRYFEGAWSELPDFDAMTPVNEGIATTVAVPEGAAAEDIGLVLEGYLRVLHRGLYRLHLWSDDGSILHLGDEVLIDNDGLHGTSDVHADAALEAGVWPFRLEFFQHLGGVDLQLWWEGPGIELARVPVEALWH